jgi:hypothetical protein
VPLSDPCGVSSNRNSVLCPSQIHAGCSATGTASCAPLRSIVGVLQQEQRPVPLSDPCGVLRLTVDEGTQIEGASSYDLHVANKLHYIV